MNSAVVNGDGHVMMMIIQVWQVDCLWLEVSVVCLQNWSMGANGHNNVCIIELSFIEL